MAIRDRALDAWELALVTTVIHYMNESLVDLDTLGTQDYDFARQAKHWSEMKGYGLGLQFSPMRSAGTDSQRLARHAEISGLIESLGTGPTLEASQREAGRARLLDARAALVDLYDLDPATAGGDDGFDGW